MIHHRSHHHLKGGRGGDPRTLQHRRGGIGVVAAHRVTAHTEAGAHPRKEGGGGVKELFLRPFGVTAHAVGVKALALYRDPTLCGGRSDGDDVEIHGGGDYAAAIVVGVVAGDLRATGNRKEPHLALVTVQRAEFLHGVAVALFLKSDVFLAVERGKPRVERSVFDM